MDCFLIALRMYHLFKFFIIFGGIIAVRLASIFHSLLSISLCSMCSNSLDAMCTMTSFGSRRLHIHSNTTLPFEIQYTINFVETVNLYSYLHFYRKVWMDTFNG